MNTTPDGCTAACAEQHTYRLDTCALAGTEIDEGAVDPSWSVHCPKCQALPGQPCRRANGTVAVVQHDRRWQLFDAADDQGARWTEKPAAGYCPHCGRGDAGPTADEYDQQRQQTEAAKRSAIRLQTRIDAVREWARCNLEGDQLTALLSRLRGDQPTLDLPERRP
ncbi:hypothetical protein [Streptomyces sp. ISL-94]|uniref:hypothetical protein n=1 Tax=Streptomyces sp. ISL-94 TaxID=2819190 RepID=UPI001BED0A96|nr:hypothetical protein [Streptomyces sp. ISL-94]MBT2477615.1 hypothetical protein [Streptomyces sp. ISL-94]